MGFSIITVDTFTNLPFPLGTGDHLIVRAAGSLTALDAITLAMGAGTSLRVEGSIFSTNAFTTIVGSSGDGMTVDIATGGSVYATMANYAMEFAFRTTIINAGTIAAYDGAAILASGAMDLTNTGQILAADSAIVVNETVTAATIVNDGLIRGGTGPGAEFVPGHGIEVLSAGTRIVNRGTIESQFAGADAVRLLTDNSAAGTVTIENDGTIRGSNGYGVNGGFSFVNGMTLVNTGVITGSTGAVNGTGVDDAIQNEGRLAISQPNAQAVVLGAGNDFLVNNGIIEGVVSLGLDDDRYDGVNSRRGVNVDGSDGNDVLIGGAFDDTLYGGSLEDALYGGAGDDYLGDLAGNTLVRGGAGDDIVELYGTDSTVFGGAGDDSVLGGGGVDQLFGGSGDDTLIGGAGNDVYGLTGLGDIVNESAGTGNGARDRVQSGYINLDLNVYLNVEDATLTGVGAFRLTGTDGANILTGNVAANAITGGAGNDTIAGGGGADVITGGAGADSQTGGAGADVFVLLSAAETGLAPSTRDVITDFTVGVDDLRMVFMNSFVGAAGFTAAGQVRYVAATGVLSGSTDADASSEWQVQMATGLALTSADFVF